MFTPETARSVMYPILLTLGGSALLASIAFFAKKYFIGRGGIGRSNQWEVDSGGGGAGGRQVRAHLLYNFTTLLGVPSLARF